MEIAPDVSVPDEALTFRFVQSSGPGGQNVNKVATAVQLRVSVYLLRLSLGASDRLRVLAGRRLNSEDVIVIAAQRFRTQERNRQDALDRLAELIRKARIVPRPRLKTRISANAKRRRLEAKKRVGQKKKLRKAGPDA